MTNTTNTTNTNEKVAVIKATAPRSRKFLSKRLHAAYCKEILAPLYQEVPVYKMITVIGEGNEGDLLYTVCYVTGANSEVYREFKKHYPTQDGVRMDVFSLNDKMETVGKRSIVTGERYHYVKENVVVKFKFQDQDDPNAAAANDELVERILLKGLGVAGGRYVVGGNIMPFVWSNSNERGGAMLSSTVDPKKLFEILETVGGGAYSRGTKLSWKKFQKDASRWGMFQTPSLEGLEIGNDKRGFILVKESFTALKEFNDVVEGIAADLNKEVDQYDGIALWSAEAMQELLAHLGVTIPLSHALQFNAQMRFTSIYAKVFADTITKEWMKLLIAALDRLGIEYTKVGNPDNIVAIFDKNAAKMMDFKNATKFHMNCRTFIMDIAKGSDSWSSNQGLSKYYAANKTLTLATVRNGIKRDVLDHMSGLGMELNSISLADYHKTPWRTLVNMAGKDQDLHDQLVGNKEAGIHGNAWVLGEILKEGNTFLQSAVRKCSYNWNGLFQRAVFDLVEMVIGKKILSTNNRGRIEVYSPDICDKFRKEIEAIENNPDLTEEEKEVALFHLLKCDVIKYPTPGDEEIVPLIPLTLRQLFKRINALVNELGMEVVLAIREYYQYTGWGTIKIASSNVFKRMLAGMDTDYDGVVCIFDKTLVNITEARIASQEQEMNAALIAKGEKPATYGGIVPFIEAGRNN